MIKSKTREVLTIAQFIENKGLSPLARELGMCIATLHNWREYISSPRPTQAKKIISLSQGKLTWESIYSPYVAHRRKQLKKLNKDQPKQLSLF